MADSAPKAAISTQQRFWSVTFFAALILLTETVLAHCLEILHDFFIAVAVISNAVLGIGLGAFVASMVREIEAEEMRLSARGQRRFTAADDLAWRATQAIHEAVFSGDQERILAPPINETYSERIFYSVLFFAYFFFFCRLFFFFRLIIPYHFFCWADFK